MLYHLYQIIHPRQERLVTRPPQRLPRHSSPRSERRTNEIDRRPRVGLIFPPVSQRLQESKKWFGLRLCCLAIKGRAKKTQRTFKKTLSNIHGPVASGIRTFSDSDSQLNLQTPSEKEDMDKSVYGCLSPNFSPIGSRTSLRTSPDNFTLGRVWQVFYTHLLSDDSFAADNWRALSAEVWQLAQVALELPAMALPVAMCC